MKRADFVDRKQAKTAIKRNQINKCNLISISDTVDEMQEMQEMWELHNNAGSAIFLVFADVEDESSGLTQEVAERIVDFVEDSLAQKQDLLVHCFAGISRSGAVAKFVNEYLSLGNDYLENYQGHNKFVYHTLLESAGIETLRSYYTSLEETNHR